MMNAPHGKRRSPPLGKKGGLANVTGWLAYDDREYSADADTVEVVAARWVARHARVPLSTARVVCLLAGIGGRLA